MSKKVIKIIIIFIMITMITTTTINIYIINKTKNSIITLDSLEDKKDYTIIVLGAAVYDKKLSYMLKDRLETTLNIYNQTNAKILISGDNQNEDYDEIGPMRNYLLYYNIPEDKLIIDKYGLSTYDSIYRAKFEYNLDKVIIVTQEYHLYRAMYIANELKVDYYGIPTKDIKYKGQSYRNLREFLARVKDFFKTKIQSKLKKKINWKYEVHK